MRSMDAREHVYQTSLNESITEKEKMLVIRFPCPPSTIFSKACFIRMYKTLDSVITRSILTEIFLQILFTFTNNAEHVQQHMLFIFQYMFYFNPLPHNTAF